MAVSLDDLFDLRNDLIGLSHEEPLDAYPEAMERLLVARTYYCIYHDAREVAIAAGFAAPVSGSVHKALWRFYKDRRLRKYKSIGHWGSDLHDMRNAADYDIGQPFTTKLVDALDLSEDILRRVAEFEGDAPTHKD